MTRRKSAVAWKHYTDNNTVRISTLVSVHLDVPVPVMMEKKNNNLALCKVCLTSPSSIAQAASEVLYSTSVGKLLFNVDRDKRISSES